jgi:hypothetical protein
MITALSHTITTSQNASSIACSRCARGIRTFIGREDSTRQDTR